MPEGDSIFRTAAQLHATLAGQRVTRFASPVPELKEQSVAGQKIVQVRAQGKYVILELSDGRALLSHLRMQGRWLVSEKTRVPIRQLARWQREPRWDDEHTTLILETASSLAVLEDAAVAELLPLSEVERRLASLGPDLLSPDYDPNEALRRLRDHPQLSIGEALMLQSIVAGIGNVYKSETLFIEKVSPWASVATLDDATLARLLKRARELLRRNLTGPRRTTFGTFAGSAYFVYERSGQHCLKCDSKVRMLRQGTLQRSTYFCPECQGVAPG
jgi:endonuclease-8